MKKLVLVFLCCMTYGLLSGGTFAFASEISELEQLLEDAHIQESWTNAAIYHKKLAEYYDKNEEYEKAAHHYDASAIDWTKAGHADWGIKNSIRADHIQTELELYIEETDALHRPLEKFEPASGSYIGMFLAGKREQENPDLVKDIYDKSHSMFLTYTHWRKTYPETNSYFPMAFAEEAKKNGAGIQIGWEPGNGLEDVLDDEYVRQFAREAKQAGIPVFLRFAGEMNGEWVPWSGDPELYKEKFRLVSTIMKEEAPNVAMVWSPNFLPRHNIDPYYPGDEYVDWVGFSLYTIPYSHGKEVPGGNPVDYLRPLYESYKHKPMMVSEGAVSHYSYELEKDYSEWAAGQIGNMYGFLPKIYPQVKAVTYFNLDKKTTNYDNKNNNYDLGDSAIVDESYKRMIQDTFFLSEIRTKKQDSNATVYKPLNEVRHTEGKRRAFGYVKLPLGEQPYYVAVFQGDHKLSESYAQPWDFRLDFSTIDPTQPVTMMAFDEDFKRLAEKDFVFAE